MIYLVPATIPDKVTLIFQFPPAREIKQVCVAGSFNFFSQTATPLKQAVPNGPWEAQVTVPRKGEVSFRYLVNASKWQLDPDIPTTRKNNKGDLFTVVNANPVDVKSSTASVTTDQDDNTSAEIRQLLGKVPSVLNKPTERIELAKAMHKAAMKPGVQPQSRLDLLQRAVSLDPFNTQVRLALGQVSRELGLHVEAVASFKQVLELRPGDAFVQLLLGEALLAAGELDQAAEMLKKVPVDSQPGRRAAYALLELDMRRCTDKDGQKLLQALTALQAQPGEEAIFSEKCLKLLSEWDSPSVCQAVLDLLETQFSGSTHPALAVVRQVTGYQLPASLVEIKNAPPSHGAGSAPQAATLIRTLNAHRLARGLPVSEAEDRVSRLASWRETSQRLGSTWPELKGAYLHQLGEWAVQSYKKKNFHLAVTLWTEAERVAPNLPAVQQNLAIGNSRLGEDAAQEFYWQRLTRSWTLYNELMPEADGYDRHIIQKHQAFVQGAETKLATLKASPEEMLELGALWIKEAVSLLSLNQLAFRNPLFRCGVMRDDYVGREEKETLLEEGYTSTASMIQLSLEELGISQTSSLAHKRLYRLDQAYQQARAGGEEAFRHYDEEKEAFKRLREQAAHQYIQLLLGVLLPSAEKLNLDDAASSQRYALLARGLMIFPHRALKPAVLKTVQQLDEDTDMQQLVTNYAVGPWFKRAQEFLKNKQAAKAAPLFEEVLKIAPHFSLGMFYLAQCRIDQKQFDEIEPLLIQARDNCKPGDDLLEHIENLLEQLPMVKIAEEFHKAQEFMQEEDWKHALDFLEYCESVSPGQVPVLFYTAVCHFRMEHWDQAEKIARKALALCTGDEHKNAKEQLEVLIKQLPMARAAKAVHSAREFMDKEQWSKALGVLDKLLEQDETLLVALFYKTVCHFRLGDWNEAEQVAQDTLTMCKKDDKEIKEQLKTILEQIPLARRAAYIRPITEAIEAENWEEGIEAASTFQYEVGEDPVVLFYKALCLLRSGDRESAKDDATRGLALAKGTQYADLRGQLEKLIEASKHAVVPPQYNKAIQKMEAKQWSAALDLLDEVLDQNPDMLNAVFYKAICHFRLEDWDEAESAAQRARKLCTSSDKEIKEQVTSLLEQLKHAQRAAAMKPVKDAVQSEMWYVGIDAADDFIREYGDDPVVLFYKALCQFRSDDNSGARQTATRGQKLATGTEYREVREQLDKLIQATQRGGHVDEMNKAVRALNNEEWLEAVSILYRITSDAPGNAQAHYYLGLALFQSTMDLIKSNYSISSSDARGYRSSMEMVISHLDDAEKNSSRSDRDLRKGIDNLRKAANNVLSQLKGH